MKKTADYRHFNFNVERLFCGQRCVVRLADEDEINEFILLNCIEMLSDLQTKSLCKNVRNTIASQHRVSSIKS